MICGISDPSSMMISNLLPLLCSPAEAAGFCSDQGTKSSLQVCSRPSSRILIEVTLTSNQSELSALRNHFASSGCVLVASCPPVLAVMLVRQSSKVDSAHQESMAISAV